MTVHITSLKYLQDQARLLRLHPDIASLSSGRIGTRFLELRGMGIDSEVIVAAMLTAPVLFSWDVTCAPLMSNADQVLYIRTVIDRSAAFSKAAPYLQT